MIAPGRYFEYGNDDGDFVPVPGVGFQGSAGMRVIFQENEVGAGGMKIGFGRSPNRYVSRQKIRPNEDFREIYYRMYLKMQEGWQGDPGKLSRATVFSSASDWRQAMVAHLWGNHDQHLLLDPVNCVDNKYVRCRGYNDFSNYRWLGTKSGVTPIFGTAESGKWFVIEHHIRLNDPGKKNGLQQFWVNGQLEARQENLNFVDAYTDYGINAIFFENHWNNGSVQTQERYFDNIVISTKPIGPVAQ
ncbi:MAG: polysaccharide lyase [Pseudomonadota bacterium]